MQTAPRLRDSTIDDSTGQIRTKAGVTYNYETIADGWVLLPAELDTATIGSDRCYTVMVEVLGRPRR